MEETIEEEGEMELMLIKDNNFEEIDMGQIDEEER